MLTIKELASALNVKVPTIRSWLKKGMIPSHCYLQMGQTYRFDLEAIRAACTGLSPVPELIVSPQQQSFEFSEDIGGPTTLTASDFFGNSDEETSHE